MSIIMALEDMIDHCRYHATTEALNFFIYRIAIIPPADRNGTSMSKM